MWLRKALFVRFYSMKLLCGLFISPNRHHDKISGVWAPLEFYIEIRHHAIGAIRFFVKFWIDTFRKTSLRARPVSDYMQRKHSFFSKREMLKFQKSKHFFLSNEFDERENGGEK